MIHLLAFVLCLAGFTALDFAMERTQRDFIGRSLRKSTIRALRLAGTCALLLALGVLVFWQDWGLGLVMFSGHSSLAAGIVHCTFIAYSRVQARSSKRR